MLADSQSQCHGTIRVIIQHTGNHRQNLVTNVENNFGPVSRFTRAAVWAQQSARIEGLNRKQRHQRKQLVWFGLREREGWWKTTYNVVAHHIILFITKWEYFSWSGRCKSPTILLLHETNTCIFPTWDTDCNARTVLRRMTIYVTSIREVFIWYVFLSGL